MYGNSSLGGAISVITKKPQFEFAGNASVRYGLEYQEPRVDAAASIPLSEQLALRVAGKNLADKQYNVFTSVIPLALDGAFASVRGKGREVSLEWRLRF